MSYVDLYSNVRWTREEHADRSEAQVRSRVTHNREHVLIRRALSMLFDAVLPAGHPMRPVLFPTGAPQPTPDQLAELAAAAATFLQADTEAAEALADSALLDAALDYEQAQATLAALGPAPEGEDPDAALRQQMQAVLDDAAPAVLQLVADRAAAQP